jgi:hypothetical protein
VPDCKTACAGFGNGHDKRASQQQRRPPDERRHVRRVRVVTTQPAFASCATAKKRRGLMVVPGLRARPPDQRNPGYQGDHPPKSRSGSRDGEHSAAPKLGGVQGRARPGPTAVKRGPGCPLSRRCRDHLLVTADGASANAPHSRDAETTAATPETGHRDQDTTSRPTHDVC